jgi:ubiquinone biosynthesis protein Coq4
MKLNLKERLQSLKMVQHLLADHQFRSLMDEGWRPASIHLDQLLRALAKTHSKAEASCSRAVSSA